MVICNINKVNLLDFIKKLQVKDDTFVKEETSYMITLNNKTYQVEVYTIKINLDDFNAELFRSDKK